MNKFSIIRRIWKEETLLSCYYNYNTQLRLISNLNAEKKTTAFNEEILNNLSIQQIFKRKVYMHLYIVVIVIINRQAVKASPPCHTL